MKPTLLIMAAGMGSRYGGLKQLDGVGPCGETIMDYSIYDAIQSGFGDVVFVVREKFKEEFIQKVAAKYSGKIKTTIVTQEPSKLPDNYRLTSPREKPWGTGQAVLAASGVINKPFAVINSDDFYGRKSFEVLANYLSSLTLADKGKFCMVAFFLEKTLSESGAVSRGICSASKEGYLLDVEEHTNVRKTAEGVILGAGMNGAEHEIDSNALTSMNMWGFTPDYMEYSEKLFCKFLDKNINEPKTEFYVPFAVTSMIENKQAVVKVLSTPDKWFGVTYKEDRPLVVKKLQDMSDTGLYKSPLF